MEDLKEILISCSCRTDYTKNQAQDPIIRVAEVQKRLNVQPCQSIFSRSDREKLEHGDLEWLFG